MTPVESKEMIDNLNANCKYPAFRLYKEFEQHAVSAQLAKEDLLALVCLVNSDILANGAESWWHKDKLRLLPDEVYTCELISIYLTTCKHVSC